MAELELIARIRALAKSPSRALVAGIGDDCAVLRIPAGHETLVTTDFTLENVHFRRQWHPPQSVGHRCLARGLSDIAAMGGDPVAAFLSLALPPDFDQKWVDGFLAGLLKLADKFGVPLAGGDLAESPIPASADDGHPERSAADPPITRSTAPPIPSALILADIVVLGAVPRGHALLRSGAKPGDGVFVTGQLGVSAAVLHRLQSGERISPNAKDAAAHFFPTPRIAVGRALRGIASAAIDISDGLSTDLAHLCAESGVGAVTAEHSIPRGVRFEGGALHFALHGGEDYELLFTAPPRARVPDRVGPVRITRIGEIERDSKHRIFLSDSHGQRKQLSPRGWQHFQH